MDEMSDFQRSKQNNWSDIDLKLDQKKGQLLLKRLFDIFVSFLGLIVLCPLFIIISIIIKLDSNGPVLFKQVRVGKNGTEFNIFKFRTMIVNAEKHGMQITVGKDRRVTRVGNFLRKSKLDELPQLINVFVGHMSFVGPRPEVPRYVALYNDNQKRILKVRPGITDLSSIKFRDENEILATSINPEEKYIQEIMPIKLELNMKYINNISLINDLGLIIKTIFKIIKR
jgi:lipopolysaccharide/colanic/teichoic acid biosynthesis glycosyltransferase